MCIFPMIERLIHWLVFNAVSAVFHLFYSERNDWPFIGESAYVIFRIHVILINLFMNNDKHLANMTASYVPTYSLLP